MKKTTDSSIIKLLRAVKAASPYASRRYQWQVGTNPHLANPFSADETLGGFDELAAWTASIAHDVTVGLTLDCYVYVNEGTVAHPDWCMWTNYVVTVTSPTTATIRETGCPDRAFSL